MEQKVNLLAEQYSSLSLHDISDCLRQNSGDLNRASADLLTRKFESEAQVILSNKRCKNLSGVTEWRRHIQPCEDESLHAFCMQNLWL